MDTTLIGQSWILIALELPSIRTAWRSRGGSKQKQGRKTSRAGLDGTVFWKYRAARISQVANRLQLTTRQVESIIPESLFRHTKVAD